MEMVPSGVSATAIAGAITLAVVNIDSPTELNSNAGSNVGEFKLVYQAVAAANEWTLYTWDSASSDAELIPYRLNGSSGQWVAICGKYSNGSQFANKPCALGSILNTSILLNIGSLNVTQSILTNTSQVGAQCALVGSSGATVTIRGFGSAPTTNAVAFTCDSLVNFLALTSAKGAGSTINKAFGFAARTVSAGTNNFGFFYGTSDATTTATGTWAFYNDSASPMYTGSGAVLVNTTTDDGANKLQVNGGSALTGPLAVVSGLSVSGTTTLVGTLTTSSGANVVGALAVSGATTLVGATTVGGVLTLSSRYNLSRQTFSASTTVCGGSSTVAQNKTLTGSVTVTLPAASAYGTGVLNIFDESGTASVTNTIVVARAGSDLINGASGTTIVTAYGERTLACDGTSKWTLLSTL